jgi:hypothetical protein
MRIRPRAFQIDPDHAMSTVSLGISLYQSYENKRTLKLLKRIHRNSFSVCFGDLNMLVEFLYDEIKEYEKDKDEFMNWRLVDSPPIQIPPEYESSVSHPC